MERYGDGDDSAACLPEEPAVPTARASIRYGGEGGLDVLVAAACVRRTGEASSRSCGRGLSLVISLVQVD